MQSVQSFTGGVGVQAPGGEGELDLRALGAALWRKKWAIIIPTLLVGAVTMFVVNSMTPQYRSEAKIVVEGRENVFLRPEAEKNVDRANADQEAIATQVQIIQSRDVARTVIRELKLAERPEFDPVLSGVSRLNAILSMLGIARDRLRMSPEERVMEAYFDRLTVSAVERSRVITIEFRSADPELASKVVNAIVNAYLKQQQIAKQEQNRSASAYLANEIESLRRTVQDAEAKVEDFRGKANLYVGGGETNLTNQQLGELSTQLATARANKADLDARARLIRDMLKNGKPVESADIVNSDLLKRLVEQRVLLRAQLAEQSSTLLERHPRIQELNAQINALDTQMRGELVRLVNSIENDARIAAARIEATNDSLERLKRQVSGQSPQDVQLRALEREAKAQRDLLESYLGRYREALARDNIDASPAEARVISRASVSNVPAFPKKGPILLVATLATAFLCAAFVLSSEILKQSGMAGPRAAATPSIVEQDTPVLAEPTPERKSLLARLLRKRTAGKPATAAAPIAAVESEADVEASTTEPVAPAITATPIEDVTTALRGFGDTGRRVTVVGAARNVGATYTALGLARALAAEGKRVVLADLALNAPNLSIMSTDPQAPGFADLVRGAASFGDIITRDKFSRVHLVATGRVVGDAAAILASPRLIITLEALTRTYDHLVIDAGAIAETVAATFARVSPYAVLVATDPDSPATRSARDQLVAAGFIDVMLVRGTPKAATVEPAAA